MLAAHAPPTQLEHHLRQVAVAKEKGRAPSIPHADVEVLIHALHGSHEWAMVVTVYPSVTLERVFSYRRMMVKDDGSNHLRAGTLRVPFDYVSLVARQIDGENVKQLYLILE